MIVGAVQHLDMQVHRSAIRYGIEKLSCHFGIHIAAAIRCKLAVKHQIRTAGQIYRAQHQCFIHWQNAGAIALDSLFIANRLADGVTEDNAGIFDGMMTIHL